jgi:hypothetical protein
MGAAIGLRDKHRITVSGDMARPQSGTIVAPPALTRRKPCPAGDPDCTAEVVTAELAERTVL